jgi:catechol 2,3-dioxygenase-like lactoylglutathione lyase family enzyme
MKSVVKTHISLNVTNVEKSVAFYEAFFGVAAHKRRDGYANFDIESPALKLALNQSVVVNNPLGNLNHMGIMLDSSEAVNAARMRLQSANLIALDEGDTVCCHGRQDKVWARDPDGNAWEVYTILDDMMDGAFEAPPQDDACCTKTETVCCGIALPIIKGAKGTRCGCS